MQPSDALSQANVDYIEQLLEQYRKDPAGVPADWRMFFSGFDFAGGTGLNRAVTTAGKEVATAKSMGVFDLVHTYREIGHACSRLDPLGAARPAHPLLELDNFDMSEADLDRPVGSGGFHGATDGTLRDLLDKLQATYTRHIGVEFTHITSKQQRDWLTQRMEPTLNAPPLSSEERNHLLREVVQAEEFEHYLHRAFVGAKRFSLEGAESVIPLINGMIEGAAELGVEQVICAMAHRGRLNVLAHVVQKPLEVLLAEFEGTVAMPEGTEGDGDVKYHLGYAKARTLRNGKTIKVSLLPNPSHLELIDPIQQGIIRCKQDWLPDTERTKVVPITMHGDAAFVGQGIVAETLNLSELPGYETGGTIHVIVNNQIGFTTPPRQGRFTPYATDMAKAIQAPIFHVNGDDPEAVLHVAQMAIAFRQAFKQDVIIDLYCYRRHGHNEADEPSFTQPLMYRAISGHPSVRTQYQQKLVEAGVLTADEAAAMKTDVVDKLQNAREIARKGRPTEKVPTFGGVWRGMGRAGADWSAKTLVPRQTLQQIIDTLKNLPHDFTVHPKLSRMLGQRLQMVESGEGMDWGTAEMLALGTLLLEGNGVRFTGQDAERGTFSHRHAVLHDYENGDCYTPLQHLSEDQGPFTILNTMLSEEAVLSFEWGFSSADPRNLVVWEAQFGDFVNGAQNLIDQILAASESKWHYMSGLVLLLPHGYEGAGPEHSNAYLERFLALCAEGNMQVAMPSTPAQYFHLLRRQIHRKFRKPLVLMMPKSLLRKTEASSRVTDLTDANLKLVIDDETVTRPESIQRLLLCSGKVFYTLDAARKEQKRDDVAIVRVEQLYPFPQRELSEILSRYRRTPHVAWVQEEPKNRGAWTYMEPRLREMLPDTIVNYHGRDAAASPAAGSLRLHNQEEAELVAEAMDILRDRVTAGSGV